MTQPSVKPIPDGMHSLTPHLICAGAADAIAFYKAAFGAVELARLPGAGGKLMHAMLRIGDSALMLVDENSEWGMLGPTALKGTSLAACVSPLSIQPFAFSIAGGMNGVSAMRRLSRVPISTFGVPKYVSFGKSWLCAANSIPAMYASLSCDASYAVGALGNAQPCAREPPALRKPALRPVTNATKMIARITVFVRATLR